jgi:hypothetical protein
LPTYLVPLHVNVELLADEQSSVGIVHGVDHLQHLRIDALGVVTGQRLIAHDLRSGIDGRGSAVVLTTMPVPGKRPSRSASKK